MNVSYETGRAVVIFDRALTAPDVFIAELTRLTGYTAEVLAPEAARMTGERDSSTTHD